MRDLTLDIETYSSEDLGETGVHRYAESPDFEIQLLSYCFDDEEVRTVDLAMGDELPDELRAALTDPGVRKWAHNAAFERTCLAAWLGAPMPAEQWWDDMVLCAVCGLPMSLGEAGVALGMPEDKAKDRAGKALVRWFSQPYKATKKRPGGRHMPADYPEKWEQYREYNRQDVVAERANHNMLRRWIPGKTEHRAWVVDQGINDRGIRVDLDLARNAVAFDARYKAQLTEQAIAVSGLENPNSVTQIKAWLLEQEGLTVPSLNKKVVADVVAQLQTDRARQFMDIRKELSKSSTAKYSAMVRSVCADEHVRGCFQFCGAGRTGRWAGRRVQLQNLAKNKMEDIGTCRELVRTGDYETLELLYGNVTGCLSELVRTALIPEEGHRFIVCDYSAIEARVLAWISGEEWALEEFRGAGQIYEATGAMMFHVPKETIAKGGCNHDKRQAAKTAVLACGYGGGVNALKAFGADKMGMTEEDMVETVDLWRAANKGACKLWRELERAAIRSVVHGGTALSRTGNIRFDFEQGILWMTLPSGRRIAYFGARYGDSKWGGGRRALSYMGIDQDKHKWTRLETWGGKLTENCWAAGTPVLTGRGWVPIESVTSADRVWDGVEWVSTDGCARRDREEDLFELDGLLVTGDHKILTTRGWKNAKECDGLDRVSVQLPADRGTREKQRPARKNPLAGRMRLRASVGDRHPGSAQSGEAGAPQVLRVPDAGADLKGEHDSRDVPSPGLRGLAVHDTEMHVPDAPGLGQLRRPGDHGLRQVAAQLRELLGGHRAHLRPQHSAGSGPEKKQRGLLPGKLPLGDQKSQLPEPAQDSLRVFRRGDNDRIGAGGTVRCPLYNAAVPAGPRLSVRPAARRAGHDTPVYDVVNCGPRRRYVVLGATGPIIAHNCVQATARDCLRDAMQALTDAGFQIRAHIHDEVVISEPRDGRTLEEVSAIMGRALPWAPGLPLRGDGYYCDYYIKD